MLKNSNDPRNSSIEVPAVVQARLRRDGLLASPKQFWTHPSGTFTLDLLLSFEKRRNRVYHAKPIRKQAA